MKARYLIAQSESSALRIALPEAGSFSIGRDPAADITIEAAGFANLHALIHMGPDVRIEVLEEGARMQPGDAAVSAGQLVEIHPGQALDAGDVRLEIAAVTVTKKDVAMSDPGIVIEDPASHALEALVNQVASTTTPVLVLGETGVGKDEVADRIHAASRRPGQKIRVICAGLTDIGLSDAVERARDGTVVLDEVYGLSDRVQSALRNALEVAEDVRFVATSNHDIEAAAADGRFGQDLLYRLNAVTIDVPALRTRPKDILPLAERFTRHACKAAGRQSAPTLSDAAQAQLLAYGWPGNVRELKNAVERAVIVCRGDAIEPEDLPILRSRASSAPASSGAASLGPGSSAPPSMGPSSSAPPSVGSPSVEPHSVGPGPSAPPADDDPPSGNLRDELAALEKKRIVAALDRYDTQAEAATALGVPLRTFRNRLDALGIPRKKN